MPTRRLLPRVPVRPWRSSCLCPRPRGSDRGSMCPWGCGGAHAHGCTHARVVSRPLACLPSSLRRMGRCVRGPQGEYVCKWVQAHLRTCHARLQKWASWAPAEAFNFVPGFNRWACEAWWALAGEPAMPVGIAKPASHPLLLPLTPPVASQHHRAPPPLESFTRMPSKKLYITCVPLKIEFAPTCHWIKLSRPLCHSVHNLLSFHC
jgi:hypothetical protein